MSNAIRTENLVKRFRKVEALGGLDMAWRPHTEKDGRTRP